MNPEDFWFWAGFGTAGVLYAYFASDGHRANKISSYTDEYLIQEAVDFVTNNSFDELIKTNEIKLPKKFIEELRLRPIVVDKGAHNIENRYRSQFYQTSRGLVERTIPIGPISWVSKRLALRSLTKNLKRK